MDQTPVRTRPVIGRARLAVVAVTVTLALVVALASPAAEAQTTPPPEATALAPRDVLLVGDSILRSTGPALSNQLGTRYFVHNEAVNGSGLLTPRVFNWPRRLGVLLDSLRPEVVVMLFIGNYTADPAQLWTAADGSRVPDIYSPLFAREWAVQAERLVARMIRSGSKVVLVLPPPMFSARVQRVTNALRAGYLAIASRHPEVTVADATAAVGGPNGEWVARLPTTTGRLVPVRTADTVHLAPHGRGLVAREIRLALSVIRW